MNLHVHVVHIVQKLNVYMHSYSGIAFHQRRVRKIVIYVHLLKRQFLYVTV